MSWLGWGATLLFLGSLSSYKAMVMSALILLGCIFIYWGMLPYAEGLQISSLTFQSRLYLLPATLLLFIAAIWGRYWSFLVVAVPVFLGAASTYNVSKQMQETYQNIYQLASAKSGLTIYYPEKPLNDPSRQVFIGDFPDANYRIDTKTGKVLSLNGLIDSTVEQN